MRLEGRRALVTGAAGGIGLAVVSRLQADGAAVAAADRSLDGIEAAVRLPGDLTDADYCDRLPSARRRGLGAAWISWSTMPA